MDDSESLYSRKNRVACEARPTWTVPTSWQAAILEAENELKRARILVETLEMLTGHIRERMRAGDKFGE